MQSPNEPAYVAVTYSWSHVCDTRNMIRPPEVECIVIRVRKKNLKSLISRTRTGIRFTSGGRVRNFG